MAAEAGPISKVLIVVAMQTEAMPLVSKFKLVEAPAHESTFPKGAPWVRYHGNYKDLHIDLVLPGKDAVFGVDSVGTVSAVLVTSFSIQTLKPDLIINAGTAGGFKAKGASIGDVFLASDVAFHDRRIPIPVSIISHLSCMCCAGVIYPYLYGCIPICSTVRPRRPLSLTVTLYRQQCRITLPVRARYSLPTGKATAPSRVFQRLPAKMAAPASASPIGSSFRFSLSLPRSSVCLRCPLSPRAGVPVRTPVPGLLPPPLARRVSLRGRAPTACATRLSRGAGVPARTPVPGLLPPPLARRVALRGRTPTACATQHGRARSQRHMPSDHGALAARSYVWPSPLHRRTAPTATSGSTSRRAVFLRSGKECSAAVLERKKFPNRLAVDEATNDDNFIRQHATTPALPY